MGTQLCAKHVLWDKAAAQEKGLCNDRQHAMAFPMPGRGHRVSVDHKKYDPSEPEQCKSI